MTLRSWLTIIAIALTACGNNPSGTPDSSIIDVSDASQNELEDATANLPDAPPRNYDAFVPVDCIPGDGNGGVVTECTDCLDNDNDGRADGFDIECISPADDKEGSFATGISGDNKDGTWQDCFFDGDSGAGNDGCRFNTCCLLGNCPAGFDCSITEECKTKCAPAAPPGCDCFGCCEVCIATGCYTVVINPAVAPLCDESVVADPTKCPVCTLNTVCTGGDCGGENCVLCPGQDPSTLPSTCNPEMPVCPPTSVGTCVRSSDCNDDAYACINGCCVTSF
jgi:hypothetical protein